MSHLVLKQNQNKFFFFLWKRRNKVHIPKLNFGVWQLISVLICAIPTIKTLWYIRHLQSTWVVINMDISVFIMDISVYLLMTFHHICINFCANCLNRQVLQAGYQLTSHHHTKYFEQSVSSILYLIHCLLLQEISIKFQGKSIRNHGVLPWLHRYFPPISPNNVTIGDVLIDSTSRTNHKR